jgi:pantoate--beta-alanine ligase
VKTIRTIREMQATADDVRRSGRRIGVVPTMGALHEGHLSLIGIARQHADVVVTTIFVNPTQFAPGEDFTRYPRDLERDSRLVDSAGSDLIFAPATTEMYPAGARTTVDAGELTQRLEGNSRPTHFRGVTTIVAKLFLCTKPHVAVFGQKDAQQLRVIRQMACDLNFDVDIVAGPIVREADGLAMSSRNVYLSSAERAESTVLYQSLQSARDMVRDGETRSANLIRRMTDLISSRPSARIDYISVADSATLEELETLTRGRETLISLAVRFGSTRLIDNVTLVP